MTILTRGTLGERNGRSTYLRGALLPISIIGLMNAEYLKVYSKIQSDGLVSAVVATFDISIVVWCGIGLLLYAAADISKNCWSRLDAYILLILVCAMMVPVSGASWIALSLLSIYIFYFSNGDRSSASYAVLLGALCFNGFWSPMIFRLFTELILHFDSAIIGLVTGTDVNGNLIYAADGQTTLQVLAACSSFSNVSLALLGWVIGRCYHGTSNIKRALIFLPLAVIAVIAINTTRIGVIALRPDLYELAHGAVGANIASMATTCAIYFIVKLGTQK